MVKKQESLPLELVPDPASEPSSSSSPSDSDGGILITPSDQTLQSLPLRSDLRSLVIRLYLKLPPGPCIPLYLQDLEVWPFLVDLLPSDLISKIQATLSTYPLNLFNSHLLLSQSLASVNGSTSLRAIYEGTIPTLHLSANIIQTVPYASPSLHLSRLSTLPGLHTSSLVLYPTISGGIITSVSLISISNLAALLARRNRSPHSPCRSLATIAPGYWTHILGYSRLGSCGTVQELWIRIVGMDLWEVLGYKPRIWGHRVTRFPHLPPHPRTSTWKLFL
ncbi:hypothetical protein BCR34DRAFT_592931 [Clohesyomyces aquaticus]|uniref:Uncharacterized protein n=1 Tax=Clohesyomyces aquaticus TaxID=1231657 RepID=A0A1Y1YNU0_9PLEO|nr:hypothetical protein BCR34DRAFT_592931 [Clohesyomyces aquaticus]